MAWDPTAPATNADLVSAPIRGNFAALDTTVMAPVGSLADQQVLVKQAGPVIGGIAAGAVGTVLTSTAGGPAWVIPAGGGPLRFYLERATVPDGTGTGNNPPELAREISTGTQTANTPKATTTVAKFDAGVDEHLIWEDLLPATWTAGGMLRFKWRAATATTGTVIWKAGMVFSIDGSTNDTTVIYPAADLASASAAPGTLGWLTEITITLTMTNAAAGRLLRLFVGRDADHASDTMAGDAILVSPILFEYS
jgi:hypothetical protein